MMNIIIENDGARYHGTIVSYSIKWEGRVIELRRIRYLTLHNDSQHGAIVFDDDTRMELYKETILGIRRPRLKGHFVVRVASLNTDMRFDVQSVDTIEFSADSQPTGVP